MRNNLYRGLKVRQTAYARQLGLRGLRDAGPDDALRRAGVEDEVARLVVQRAGFLSSLSIDDTQWCEQSEVKTQRACTCGQSARAGSVPVMSHRRSVVTCAGGSAQC